MQRARHQRDGWVIGVTRFHRSGRYGRCRCWSERNESAGCGEHELAARTPIFQTPTVRHRQTGAVAMAQIVRVRIAFGGEVVEPYRGARVLVGEGNEGWFGTSRPRTLALHGLKIYDGTASVVDHAPEVAHHVVLEGSALDDRTAHLTVSHSCIARSMDK